jgi:uncharacterized protein (DUF302 family)
METTKIGLHARVAGTIVEVERLLRDALAEEGFGILTEVDAQQVLNEKVGVDIGPYRLLGACNPQLAHSILGRWKGFGVFLPCTVVLYQVDDDTVIEAFDPMTVPVIRDHAELVQTATEVRERIARALAAVEREGRAAS